ncbi:MAG: LLM class flavin-dependent oxidoreductase [Gammaproteobacteria bacterium]|jgi:alkanesulfonate monooxygenase SsuD/methylene tetrahydromethanopterin reductase-like flavin-dependent oxidoreductase (luciferase family)
MIDFNLFIYCTVGRREELERGMAGKDPVLYRRMLEEIAGYARLADELGYAGFGHPEHHLQIEGFEASNDPTLMGMWLGMHTQRLRVITCGFVATVHNPLRTAEAIATMDNMLNGRFGVGLVRGYQSRWVENFKVQPELGAVGAWNKDEPVDQLNREYFAEYVDIVIKALTHDTFSHSGRFWQFPPADFVNPHDHPVYRDYGHGVSADMRISEIGIAPRPMQRPTPPLYGGFSASLRTAKFWAKYQGKPIVLAPNLDLCRVLWNGYREEAEGVYGHTVAPGDEAAWGGIMICAPSDEEARAWADEMDWFWKLWPTAFGQGAVNWLVGSPDTITRQIEEAAAEIPINEMFLLLPQGIHEPAKINTSLELFATKVMPRFQ